MVGEVGRREGEDDTPIGLPVICSNILRLAASRESVCALCCSWIIFFSSVCMTLLTNSVSSSNTPPIASLFDGFDLFGKAGNPSDDSELTILFISSFGQRSSLPVVKISSLLVTLSGFVKEYLYPNILGNVWLLVYPIKRSRPFLPLPPYKYVNILHVL